jgi:hypothetical protein
MLKKHSIKEPYMRGWINELERTAEERRNRFEEQRKAIEEYKKRHPKGPYE